MVRPGSLQSSAQFAPLDDGSGGSNDNAARPQHPAQSAATFEEIVQKLIPVRLENFVDGRGFGFLRDADGNKIFAHVSSLRILYPGDNRLHPALGRPITDECFGDNPDLYCMVGPGKNPGEFAAIVWVGTDISHE